MFVCLFAELVSSQVIFFAMGDRRRRVRVGRKVVEFCCSLVCSLWHNGSPSQWIFLSRLSSSLPFDDGQSFHSSNYDSVVMEKLVAIAQIARGMAKTIVFDGRLDESGRISGQDRLSDTWNRVKQYFLPRRACQ